MRPHGTLYIPRDLASKMMQQNFPNFSQKVQIDCPTTNPGELISCTKKGWFST